MNKYAQITNTLLVSTFAVMLGLGVIAPLLPVYVHDLGASGLWVGAIFAIFSVSRIIFIPLFGKLSDRRGRKSFITIGLAGYTFVSFLYSIANNLPMLLGIRFLHGFFSSMVIPITMAYLGEVAEPGREGRMMGWFNMAMFLGMAGGPSLGGVLKDTVGYASVFYAMMGLTGLAFLMSVTMLPDIKLSGKYETSRAVSFRIILRDKAIQAVLLFRINNAVARGALMSFLPILAMHLSAAQIGILISVNVFLTAFLQKIFGDLADRWSNCALIVGGSLLTTLSIAIVPLFGSFNGLLITGAIFGIASGISIPAASSLNIKIGKRNGGMGATVSLFNTAQNIGWLVAPVLAGFIYDSLGLKAIFFGVAVISLLGTLGFYLLIREPLKNQHC
jgi:MFS family permease